MPLAYIIAMLLIMFLIVLSCRMSLVLDTKRTFKPRSLPAPRRSRGAVICSPELQDAIFARNEKYRAFRVAKVEVDPGLDY